MRKVHSGAISDKDLIFSALSDVYFGLYYLDLPGNVYSTIKMAPGEEQIEANESELSVVLQNFINNVVAPDDREKMREFMNMDTLQLRLGSNKCVDCEYRSLSVHGWCRARLIPIKYDENGRMIKVLFIISALDKEKARALYSNDYDKKSLMALFDHVPGGVVMYEWNGKKFKTIHISKWCEKKYGYSLTNPLEEKSEGSDFRRVHPDDLKGYRKVIKNALEKSEGLHYVYRAWDDEEKRYFWVRIDAVINPQRDGTAFIYALYTDVTEQKELEIRLNKHRASLNAALGISNQFCYEYDPFNRTSTCFTDENFVGLPLFIEDYPESLRDVDIIHPDDVEAFIATAHKMDEGAEKAQCDVRIKIDGKYVWYACTFDAYFDTEKERNVAILNVADISMRVTAINQYKERMHSILASQKDSLSICNLNLTKNTLEIMNRDGVVEQSLDAEMTPESVLLRFAESIIDDGTRKIYKKLFSKEYLLEQAAGGNTHVQLEYLIKMNEEHYEWLKTSIDLLENPITGDIEGVVYTKSTQVPHMTNLLLGKTVEQDYLFAVTVFVDTDEFYVYNSRRGKYSECKQDFWNAALSDPNMSCSDETLEQLKVLFVKEKVIRELERSDEYSFVFNSLYSGIVSRLELRFSYLDESRTMLLVSLRNITDSILLNKYRHDSEHDSLTDLYNRAKFISESEKLLKEHPKEQFAIIHFDIKNFHRYNTFFGEKAGSTRKSER